MLIYDLPIEPIPSRYSEQWAVWFKEAFERRGHEVYQVTSAETDQAWRDLPTGMFLDPVRTTYWKADQLAKLSHRLGNTRGSCAVFVHDAWFPGLEAVGYMRDLLGLKVGVFGYFHAGSYDDTDLLGRVEMGRWVAGCEESWLAMMDGVFVGTHYHKGLLARRGAHAKVHVVGNPVEVPMDKRREVGRENIVVWPHRESPDKQPWVADLVEERIKAWKGDWRLVRTARERLSKEEYYDLLGRARIAVSAADHENFGIAMVEAALLGCWPVVPDRLAYREVFGPGVRYSSRKEMFHLLDAFATGSAYPGWGRNVNPYDQIAVCGNVCIEIEDAMRRKGWSTD